MKSVLALIVLAGVAQSASGAVVYNDRAAWSLASGAGAAQETFEGYLPGVYASPFGFISGLFAGTTNASVQMAVEAGNPNFYGFQNTTPAGAQYLRFQDGTGAHSVGLAVFGGGLTAMGLDLSGFQPTANGVGGLTINLYDGALQLISSDFYPSATDFNAQFVGVTSAIPFAGMELVFAPVGGGTADFVAIDDVTWVVPTPGAAALLGMGGLLAARRRRA